MVVVPAGSFMMGSPGSEEGRNANEGPQHRVTITEPFAVGKYEVTFEEWDACVADGGCGGYQPDSEGWARGRHPVINVSWADAQAYVNWLSQETDQFYGLLTEAEWEYVARAGTTTRYSLNDYITTGHANYSANYGAIMGNRATVGSYPGNPWGLHDVHGNVWEWVEDCWNDSYMGAPTDGSAWVQENCSRRVLRGGSWDEPPGNLRSARRLGDGPGSRYNYLGFRVFRKLTS
jgi:formylglycine-generating enzyme required for sulfatase activity